MNNFNQMSAYDVQDISTEEMQDTVGGKSPWLAIGIGVVLIGVAIAAEVGTAGLASVPAAETAAVGVACILGGAAAL